MEPNAQEKGIGLKQKSIVVVFWILLVATGFLIGRETAPEVEKFMTAEEQADWVRGYLEFHPQEVRTYAGDAFELIDRVHGCLVLPHAPAPSPWPSTDEMRMIFDRKCFPGVLREHLRELGDSIIPVEALHYHEDDH
jgi:hypothetical protein